MTNASEKSSRNSCAIAQFKTWNLDPTVAQLIAPTCFNVFRNMTSFHINNSFLKAAIEKLDDKGAFDFNGKLLYLGLEDIFNITGLPVDGSPIVCKDFDPQEILMDLLGDDDPARKSGSYYVKKTWLSSRFKTVKAEGIHDEESRKLWLTRYARAYLLFLIGTILFPVNNKHTVFIGYLLFLTDLTPGVVNGFAWGAAVLAKLHDGFDQRIISGGAMWIVEMFLLERIPLIRKEYLKLSEYKKTKSTQFPSALHWSALMKNVSANMHLNIDWKSLLDQVQSQTDLTIGNMKAALQFVQDVKISWRPYRRFRNGNKRIFYSHFPIFDMNIIKLHKPELSPKQLGIEEVNLEEILPLRIKQKSKQGAANWDFIKKYEKEIKFCNDNRYISVVQGREGVLPPPPPSPQPHSPQRNDERLEDEEQHRYDDGNRDNEEREQRDERLEENGGYNGGYDDENTDIGSGLLADNVSKEVARSSYENEDIPASSSHCKQQDDRNEDSPATCNKLNHLHSHPSAQPPLFTKKRERLGEEFQVYTRKRLQDHCSVQEKSSETESEREQKRKRAEFVDGSSCFTKKTLVLDVNGLLADIVSKRVVLPSWTSSWTSNPYKIIKNKAVFKRPHVDDFLKFCFERFNVGVWSSRLKVNLDPVLDYVFGNNYKSKLAFQWDQKHCTDTGDKVQGDEQKPMFLKEIKKLWEDPELRKVIGVLNESNTLLLDDSPYKAKKNPPNTSIFPDTYKYKSLDDNSLGDGGDIRVYLEKLSSAPNVQKFVEQNKLFSRL